MRKLRLKVRGNRFKLPVSTRPMEQSTDRSMEKYPKKDMNERRPPKRK